MGHNGERSPRLLRRQLEQRQSHADLSGRAGRGKRVGSRRGEFRAHAASVVGDGYRKPRSRLLQRNLNARRPRLDGVLRNIQNVERKFLHINILPFKPVGTDRRDTFAPSTCPVKNRSARRGLAAPLRPPGSSAPAGIRGLQSPRGDARPRKRSFAFP
ncbi:hypothetical protein SDC9_98307 [bioreactor metagenome]|uniref:Uncharacterized protein n=1 Tax=bioreactor metagenome TaxID=1076179 RepID=A0A645AFR6_9ZZZZ